MYWNEDGDEHGRGSGSAISLMVSELSINELLEEAKASLILFTELKVEGVPSTNQEGDVGQENQGGSSGAEKVQHMANDLFL